MLHVAEAGEDRGRVVLALNSSGALPGIALESAVRVAQAFHAELESLFVDDEQLYDLAAYPFSQEVSLTGERARDLNPSLLERDVSAAASRVQHHLAATAAASRIRTRSRTVRGEPVQSLARACAENGPWNVVALADAFDACDSRQLATLFKHVDATTGFILSGANARRTGGAVVGLVEDVDRATSMLTVVERLARVTGGQAHLWILEDGAERLSWLEGQVRLTLGLKLAPVTVKGFDMSETPVSELARHLSEAHAGFSIARFGGRIAPFGENGETCDVPIAPLLEGPLFVVR